MSDLHNLGEKCVPTMEQVRTKLADVIELVEGVLARVDEFSLRSKPLIAGCSLICGRRPMRALRAYGRKSRRHRCLFLSARRMMSPRK
jgi:hypothetical protein